MVIKVLVEVWCLAALVVRMCSGQLGLGGDAIAGGGADVMIKVVVARIMASFNRSGGCGVI